MIFLDYCYICNKKNLPPSNFCFFNHHYSDFVYCGNADCKQKILNKLFIYEMNYCIYSN